MISLAGFVIQTSGHHFYDSAGGSWCWISENYVEYRISFHYGIILGIASLLIILYAIMLAVLYNRQRKMSAQESKRILQSVNRKLIWYPLAYIVLVTPLAIGNLILSGCIFTCAGLTDSIIYGITRNVVSVKSMLNVVPKFLRINRTRSKSGISPNDIGSKLDLSSFISVTKTREIRISIVGTSAESNSTTVLNNSYIDEIDDLKI
ncbi:14472_t:CDS:2 [Cetraspora pellucida]|uniref:14472_t:CDS:1 n=1 Tax=Cetraspora pellucida TaxID=1433469 RepID=A0A9N9CSQ3_9GLOM|nr:14472_t:CDS:2 [Cetraspora pellucida]